MNDFKEINQNNSQVDCISEYSNSSKKVEIIEKINEKKVPKSIILKNKFIIIIILILFISLFLGILLKINKDYQYNIINISHQQNEINQKIANITNIKKLKKYNYIEFTKIYYIINSNTNDGFDSILNNLSNDDIEKIDVYILKNEYDYLTKTQTRTNKIKFIFKNNNTNITFDKLFPIKRHILSLDFSNFNFSLYKNLSFMFTNFNNLTMLNLSNINISNVKDFNNMIYNCNNLKIIDFSNVKFTDISIISKILGNCDKIEKIYCNDDILNITLFSNYNIKCSSI